MKEELAERLLAKVMNWTPQIVAKERPVLQALATAKYDEYQQFIPGMRFIESLAVWLNQFDEKDRETAYGFIRSHLLFVSSVEMVHLVSISYPHYIRPLLIKKTAKNSKLPEWNIKKIVSTSDFKFLQRKVLFLGLSDGAHTDWFRRNNSELRHEQIWQTYELTKEKAEDMKEYLKEDLRKLGDKTENEPKFQVLVFLDDFSGSGASLLREEKGSFKGKIDKIIKKINDPTDSMNKLVDLKSLEVYIVLYVATIEASSNIEENMKRYMNSKDVHFSLELLIIQKIPDSKLKIGKITAFFKKYFDEKVKDNHYEKGKHDKPFLGFNEGGYPLVLSHNTPNNSLPILWSNVSDNKNDNFLGLFPRVSRHKEEI